MPPNNKDIGATLAASIDEDCSEIRSQKDATPHTAPPSQIDWPNVIGLTLLHIGALIGFCVFPWSHPLTWIWTLCVGMACNVSVTAGSHRLWSHRSYKAKLPLRILLAVVNLAAAQNDIVEWTRDHRVHHKYSETESDPHNAKRGFFFSHMGWLCVKKHPSVIESYKKVDMSDIRADPVCRMQEKFYIPGVVLMCFIMPAVVPWYFWGESIIIGFFVSSVLRYCLNLHTTWCVNSVAHLWGDRPYDRFINPCQSILVSIGAMGEGWHNYHHTFPQDYAASELGWKINLTTMFIDFMAAIGQVTDRKKIAPEMVKRRMHRTGDGSKGYATSAH